MFETTILPRLSETDALGHINNTCLPVWFEESRRGLFDLFNPGLKFETWNLVVRKYEIDISAQISVLRDVTVLTWLNHIGRKSFSVDQEVHQNGRLVATGMTWLVYFDFAQQCSAAIPDETKRRLLPHLRNSAAGAEE